MNSGVFKCSICENDFIAETYANTNGVVQLYEADEVSLKYFRLKERSSGLSHNRKIAGLYHTRGGSEESREHTKHAEEQEKKYSNIVKEMEDIENKLKFEIKR